MLARSMKAAVLYGREDLRVEQVEARPLAAGGVRLRIEAALTCGTDLKVFKRGYHSCMITPPAVFGHEMAGLISEVAPDVGAWRVGDRVVVANSAPCGQCFYCRNQQENLCDDLLFLNGAYAESVAISQRLVQRNLLRLQDQTSFRDAALAEPLACVVQGVRDCHLHKGQRVLIIGSGPIGLMFVALARHSGCNVTLAGRREQRLDRARKLGAEQTIVVPRECDMIKVITDAAPQPFDVVIEAVGQPETWEAAVQLARKGGTVNFFGGCPSGTAVKLDTGRLHYGALTLLASFHHTPATFRQALSFIEKGLIRSADFVDGDCALDDLPQLFKSM
ncbi:MAG TPA: zinc-binding dehydrogenase, partial [Candidatus Binatia bacterium]|nr:zinc-binding dehydrogenase [Candidatus Binatia bacterium]